MPAKLKRIIQILVLTIIILVTTTTLIKVFIYKEKTPGILGWKTFIVLSGSMEPEFYAGDIIVVKEMKNEKLKKGDIIAFQDNETIVTHRIIDIIKNENEEKYVTKGDNNNTEDSKYVFQEEIEGIYKFKISKIGKIILFIKSPIGIITSLLIIGIIILLIKI